jgi:hypothetical protein
MVSSFIPFLRNFWQIQITKLDVEKFFINLTNQAIDYREKSGLTQTDFLQQMIETKEKKKLNERDLVSHAGTCANKYKLCLYVVREIELSKNCE